MNWIPAEFKVMAISLVHCSFTTITMYTALYYISARFKSTRCHSCVRDAGMYSFNIQKFVSRNFEGV